MRQANVKQAIPAVVAETIGLRLRRYAPRTLRVEGDPARQLGPALGQPALLDADPAQCVVWVGDGTTVSGISQARVAALGLRCTGVVIIAEPIVPGTGLGLRMLKHLDRRAQRIETDEVPDGQGGLRPRQPWEATSWWIVAEVAAWRFQPGAEMAREGFLARLAALHGASLVAAVDRILERWPHAHEAIVMALGSCSSTGGDGGSAVATLFDRLARATEVSPAIMEAARNAVFTEGAGRRMDDAVRSAKQALRRAG